MVIEWTLIYVDYYSPDNYWSDEFPKEGVLMISMTNTATVDERFPQHAMKNFCFSNTYVKLYPAIKINDESESEEIIGDASVVLENGVITNQYSYGTGSAIYLNTYGIDTSIANVSFSHNYANDSVPDIEIDHALSVRIEKGCSFYMSTTEESTVLNVLSQKTGVLIISDSTFDCLGMFD